MNESHIKEYTLWLEDKTDRKLPTGVDPERK